MAKKPEVHYTGYAQAISAYEASPPSHSTTSKGGLNQFETSSKAVYKDQYDGSSYSFDRTHKGGEFVDGRSGRYGYKEEVSYKSSVKVNDSWTGCTDEYQTQVRFKQVTTYPATSNHKGSSKSKSINYH